MTAIQKCFLQVLRLVTVNHLGQAVCFHNTLPITAIFAHKHVFPFSILTHFSLSWFSLSHPHTPLRADFFPPLTWLSPSPRLPFPSSRGCPSVCAVTPFWNVASPSPRPHSFFMSYAQHYSKVINSFFSYHVASDLPSWLLTTWKILMGIFMPLKMHPVIHPVPKRNGLAYPLVHTPIFSTMQFSMLLPSNSKRLGKQHFCCFPKETDSQQIFPMVHVVYFSSFCLIT